MGFGVGSGAVCMEIWQTHHETLVKVCVPFCQVGVMNPTI